MLAKPKWPIDGFEQWWSVYPRKVAKKFAHKCFERLRSSGEIPFEVLISATQFFARSCIGKDIKFVPHPATWLNAGRWDDDENALLDVKVCAPAMQCSNGKVLIKQGSPQAMAWERHRGWSPAGDWYSHSEWPPEDGK